ncbi:MAG: HvfC/BufC family peptide modification chaperone [Stenotrophobium sp.]
MSALTQLQQDFQNYVYRRDGRMDSQIVHSEQIGSDERLQIYADAYRLRLLEVLGNDYNGLKLLAGAGKFERLAYAYIETHPSTQFNARWYGDGLADFLRGHAPWQQEPALTEMAALDWAMSVVFDAADEPAATVDTVAEIPPPAWPGMAPVLQSAQRRLGLHWNSAAFRKAADQQTEPPALAPLDAPAEYLVWRKELAVYYRSLETNEAAALTACASGACFAELCEALLQWHDEAEVAMRAAGMLRRWVEDGLIREILLPPQP